jgi:hypothetical protein
MLVARSAKFKPRPAIQELPCVRYTEQRAGIHLTFL